MQTIKWLIAFVVFSSVMFSGLYLYKNNKLTAFGLGKKPTVVTSVSHGDSENGIFSDRIVIGSSSALTGHVSFFAEYLFGAKAYFEKVNSKGGVLGRKVDLISYDDQYDPEMTVLNTQRLIAEDKVFSLFNYVGTPTTTKALPLINEAKIPLVGIGSGGEIFRNPFQKYVFNVRASYHQEIDAFVSGAVKELGIKKIAVLYQYDAYGLDGLKGAEISLARHGLEPVVSASYQRGTDDVEQALEIIMNSKAEAVIMVSVYSPAAKFIKLAKSQGYAPIFQNLSFCGSEALMSALGDQGDGVIVTQVVPPPTEKNLLIGVNEYIADLGTYFPERTGTFSGLEGFMDAKIFVEGLNRAGRELTREKFMQALESINSYSLGIASPVSFGTAQHQGMQRVYLTYIKDGKFELFGDWKQYNEDRINMCAEVEEKKEQE